MISPFYGALSAASFIDNYDVFETLPAYATEGIRRPFIEDNPTAKAAIGMYFMNMVSATMNYSSMAQQYKTISTLMDLTQQSNKKATEKATEAGVIGRAHV